MEIKLTLLNKTKIIIKMNNKLATRLIILILFRQSRKQRNKRKIKSWDSTR